MFIVVKIAPVLTESLKVIFLTRLEPSVGWRRCPNCGYFIRDPEFENPDECLSETTTEDEPLPPSKDMILGKGGVEYNMHAGFCLMTQIFPDSVHRVCTK